MNDRCYWNTLPQEGPLFGCLGKSEHSSFFLEIHVRDTHWHSEGSGKSCSEGTCWILLLLNLFDGGAFFFFFFGLSSRIINHIEFSHKRSLENLALGLAASWLQSCLGEQHTPLDSFWWSVWFPCFSSPFMDPGIIISLVLQNSPYSLKTSDRSTCLQGYTGMVVVERALLEQSARDSSTPSMPLRHV